MHIFSILVYVVTKTRTVHMTQSETNYFTNELSLSLLLTPQLFYFTVMHL